MIALSRGMGCRASMRHTHSWVSMLHFCMSQMYSLSFLYVKESGCHANKNPYHGKVTHVTQFFVMWIMSAHNLGSGVVHDLLILLQECHHFLVWCLKWSFMTFVIMAVESINAMCITCTCSSNIIIKMTGWTSQLLWQPIVFWLCQH